MLHNLSHERVQEVLHSQASLSDFVRSPMLAQPSALSAACTHGILGPQLSAKARVPTIPQEGTGPIGAAEFGAASFFPNSVSLEGSNRGKKESHTIAPRGVRQLRPRLRPHLRARLRLRRLPCACAQTRVYVLCPFCVRTVSIFVFIVPVRESIVYAEVRHCKHGAV